MNTKHTPGPWNVEFDTIYTGNPTKQPDRENVVAQAAHRGFEKDKQAERLANARLIAAAPEMLTTLQAVLDRATMPGFLRDQARAAIAKATGSAE